MHLGVWAAFALGHPRLFGMRRLFDVSEEQNVPSYVSAVALLACGLAALLNRALEMSRRDTAAWLMVAAGFAFLARRGVLAARAVQPQPPAAGPHGSVPLCLGDPLCAADLGRRRDHAAVRPCRPPPAGPLSSAAPFYVASALRMEKLEGVITTELGGRALYDHAPMRMYLAVEEGGEMLGAAILLRGLLENLRGRGATTLRIADPEPTPVSAG